MVTVAAAVAVASCPTVKLLVLSVDDITHDDMSKLVHMMSEKLILLHRHLEI